MRPDQRQPGGVDRSDLVAAALWRAGQPGEAESQRLPSHCRQQCIAPDVPFPLVTRAVPGGAVHLDRELHLLARGVQEERPATHDDPVLE
jgi:hypothetical protein